MVNPIKMLSHQTKHFKEVTMSQDNNTPKPKKYKHLTEKERGKIETLLEEGRDAKYIAERLGKGVRTIEREIKRGSVIQRDTHLRDKKVYCADYGQLVYRENAKNKGPMLKIGNDHELANYIEQKIIKDKYSPDAVIGEIKKKEINFKASICTKTLYNYIARGDVFLDLTNSDLPVKKDGKKREYKKVKISYKNLKGTSIEERPMEAEERKIYGHWEMDCVVGKRAGKGAVLLVLSERSIREEIIFKMPGKTQESVIEALDKLERLHGENFTKKFKTITVDNGSEFLNYKGMERSIDASRGNRVKVYYAHPYSSWERGTNENINKLIRRFIPKGTEIDGISEAQIKWIETWINNYPRRILDYNSAYDLLEAM